MKVRNDFVKIKANGKEYTFHNLILDTYLDLFAKGNVEINDVADYKAMNYCFIKLDNELQFNETSKISNHDFDFFMPDAMDLRNKITNGDVLFSENQVVTNYNYLSNNCLKFENNTTENVDLDEFANRKITAIAFCGSIEEQDVFSILDVSELNITIALDMDLNIKRRDTIENDIMFYSNNPQITFPVHLSPYGIPSVYESKIEDDNATIYSIGLGYYPNKMEVEERLRSYTTDTSVTGEVTIKGIEINKKGRPRYPSVRLYPSNKLYPSQRRYKYIILKYAIYEDGVNMGAFYYQAIRIDKNYGTNNLKIKYERG